MLVVWFCVCVCVCNMSVPRLNTSRLVDRKTLHDEVVPQSVINMFSSKDTGIFQAHFAYTLPVNAVMVGSPKTGKTSTAAYMASDPSSNFYMHHKHVYLFGNKGDSNAVMAKAVIPYTSSMTHDNDVQSLQGDSRTIIWDDLPLENKSVRQSLESSVQNNRHFGKFTNNMVLTQSLDPLIGKRNPQLQAAVQGVFFANKDASMFQAHTKKLSSLLGQDKSSLDRLFANQRGRANEHKMVYVAKNVADHFVTIHTGEQPARPVVINLHELYNDPHKRIRDVEPVSVKEPAGKRTEYDEETDSDS